MGKGRWLHDPQSQRIWIKAAGLALLIGPMFLFFAMVLQDGFSCSSTVLPVASSSSLREVQPSSTLSPADALASFDSPCLSRIQHLNYRPTSQIISPSAAWEKAFHAYEIFYGECSQGRNWTFEYLAGSWASSDSRTGSCSRVLVYSEGPAGLGNRLLSLTSAFLYSLLTKRVFLLDSRGHVAKLLCQPFRDSSWLLPSDFPFEALEKASSLREAVAPGAPASKVVSLHLDHDQSSGDQLFFCSETRERLKSVPWLVWTSNQYYVPRFFTFPELWQPLTALFPNVSLTFTYLSRRLLLPSNPVWQKIVRIYSSYVLQADERVGIQIRRHFVSNSGEYDDAAFQRILYCLTGNKILPNFELGQGGMKKGSQRRVSRRGVHYAVLVMSLQIRFFEELRDLYANMATVDGSLVRVHMVSHEGMEWHSLDQAQKAFVEMWLLSLSDRIATSSWSTFGYIAQGLGAMRPLVVDLRGEISRKDSSPLNSSCYFAQSIEPCNHYPYYRTRSPCHENQTTAHLTWIGDNLRPCQDFPQGLQLVV